MNYIQNKLDEFDKIVDGIDKDEVEYDFGWWETSTGADFGKSKKDELSIFIKQAITDYHNHIVDKVKELQSITDKDVAPDTYGTFDEVITTLQDTNKE